MIKVSVIIPVYNVEIYLKETLDSVVNQTLDSIEIIVINDGSTDNSQRIIDSYCKEYKNIISITQENSGVSVARNKGISIASGDYIAFLDSDDILPKDSLEIRYNLAIKNNADIIIGGTMKFESNYEVIMQNHLLGDGLRFIEYNKELLYTLGPCNKLYKSSIIKNLSFPLGISYAEDHLFVFKSYISAKIIYSTNIIIYYYRIRNQNRNISLTQKMFRDYIEVLESLFFIVNEIFLYLDKSYSNYLLSLNIKSNYLDRVLQYDIWPILKNAINSGDENIQLKILDIFSDFIKSIDRNIINRNERIMWIITLGIMSNYRYLSSKIRKEYLIFLEDIHIIINENIKYNFYIKHKYLRDSIFKAITKKNTFYLTSFYIVNKLVDTFSNRKLFYKKFKTKINNKINAFIIRVGFYSGKLYKLDKHKIVLATNRDKYLNGNLKFIFNELDKHSCFNIKLYLNTNGKYNKLEIIKMYFDFATSNYIIIDDYYRQLYKFKLRKDTSLIQVWHACGAFKKFGFSAINYNESNTNDFETRAHSKYTWVITSSPIVNKNYEDAFNIDGEKVLSLGIPRTDMFSDIDMVEYINIKLNNIYPTIKNKNVILYAPTFRGNSYQRQQFRMNFDFKYISDELGDDYIILLKMHPSVTKNSIIIPDEYREKVLNVSSYDDINELLTITDILITDYSSVIFEYSLLEKPIIFFAYDLYLYEFERSFYYDYESFVPGPIVYDSKSIIEVIQNGDFDIEKIKEFKEKFMKSCDGRSSQRLVDFILKNMED